MIQNEKLPLPDDWSVFKSRGKHSPDEIRCIKCMFADDPRLEELGLAYWIDIYRSRKRKRKKEGFRVLETKVTATGIIYPY